MSKGGRKTAIESIDYEAERFDVIALAGDIGNPFSFDGSYQKFISKCTERAKQVLVIAGNHEYYHKREFPIQNEGSMYSVGQTAVKLNEICKIVSAQSDEFNRKLLAEARSTDVFQSDNWRGNARFLDNDSFIYRGFDVDKKPKPNGLKFIGTTLWSKIMPVQEPVISNVINDYRFIVGFYPKRSTALFSQASSFINDELSKALIENVPCVVMSHHAPSLKDTSPSEYNGSAVSSAFASDFKYTQPNRPELWIFGHTHFNVDRWDERLGCRLVSNQYGYPGELC
jgi:predicted phosphodiesterase